MRILTLAIGALAIASASSAAGSALSITRSVFVETRSNGGLALEPATTLASGDKVVLVMQWSRPGAQQPFTLASRVPDELAFQRSGDASVEVSIDGDDAGVASANCAAVSGSLRPKTSRICAGALPQAMTGG